MGEWDPINGETPIDPSGLIDRSHNTRDAVNRIEGANVHKAIVKYLAGRPSKRLAKFESFDWYIQLHKEVFGDVWIYAGKIREIELNIGVPHYQVRGKLKELIETVKFWRELTDMPLIEQAARIHSIAVSIHPFEGGNGRWSRLLSNIYLRQNNEPIVEWPEETIQKASVIREEYLQAVREADELKLEPLIELHRRFQADSIG